MSDFAIHTKSVDALWIPQPYVTVPYLLLKVSAKLSPTEEAKNVSLTERHVC